MKSTTIILISISIFSVLQSPVLSSENTDRNYRNPSPPNITQSRTGQGLQLTSGEKVFWFNVCLDRGSFTQRGFSEGDLGRFPNQRNGVFLSIFNAIELNNPRHPNHPWFDNNLNSWHRGISAHLDYDSQEIHDRDSRVHFFAYDNNTNVPAGCRVTLRARNQGERPFSTSSDDCNSPNAVGCYHPGVDSNSIFIRADANWTTGSRTDETSNRINLTRTIAHELGHFLGMGHSGERRSIMNATIRSNEYQNWQSDQFIRDYVRTLRL